MIILASTMAYVKYEHMLKKSLVKSSVVFEVAPGTLLLIQLSLVRFEQTNIFCSTIQSINSFQQSSQSSD